MEGRETGRSGSVQLELDDPLHDIIDAAQRACPTVRVPPGTFAEYLRERLPPELPPALALRRIHTSDLYLACACALGDQNAFTVFDERCLSHLDRVLARMGIANDVIAEVKQDIRARVLIGDRGRAEIVDFRGRGALRAWVRVMATRRALEQTGRARRDVALDDDALLRQMVAPDDPKLEYARELYGDVFKHAFEDALQALSHRDQTLLRQHHVDSLTLDELAKLHRVHRATVARLLARARLLVLEATRARLKSQLDVSSHELDSILRMIWSRVEISVRELGHRGKR